MINLDFGKKNSNPENKYTQNFHIQVLITKRDGRQHCIPLRLLC